MFIDFLKTHYELIISCLLLLLSVLMALFKKKPVLNKIDEIKSFILLELPRLINLVECPGSGEYKKNLVLKAIQVLLRVKFNFYDFENIKSFVSESIESILSTPKKKEE